MSLFDKHLHCILSLIQIVQIVEISRLHLLWNYGFIFCCTMLYAVGCISKEMYRNVATSVNFDVIHRFGSVVCLWSYSKWSIFASPEFHGCSFIGRTTRSVLYLPKQSTKPVGRIESCSICHFLMVSWSPEHFDLSIGYWTWARDKRQSDR